MTILKETQVESSSPHFDKVFFTVNNFHPSRRGDQTDLSWQETLATAWASERVEGGGGNLTSYPPLLVMVWGIHVDTLLAVALLLR